MENVFNLNEVPVGKPENQKSIEEKEEQAERKRSLNMTDILYDLGPTNRPRKSSKNSRKSK